VQHKQKVFGGGSEVCVMEKSECIEDDSLVLLQLHGGRQKQKFAYLTVHEIGVQSSLKLDYVCALAVPQIVYLRESCVLG